MLKNFSTKLAFLLSLSISFQSCAHTVKWEGKMKTHVKTYEKALKDFNSKICVPKAESIFEQYLKDYRGSGIWIPELNEDVDVESIKSLLPVMEKKLAWIKAQRAEVVKKGLPQPKVVDSTKKILKSLLELKKDELTSDEKKKVSSRKESLKLLGSLLKNYENLIKKVSFLSNFQYPVDHLKNRKVYDGFRDKEDLESKKIANYTFLYRKLLEDGAYNKDHTGSDIYLRTTIDTLHFELNTFGFYLTEDARYDLDFVLDRIQSELSKGKDRILERLGEWEQRTQRTVDFYRSLTLPQNQIPSIAGDKDSTPNRALIREHNVATRRLKEFVYKKQAEVYKYWLNQPELPRAIFVLETILINEVGPVDGDEALERMDVARVVMNRLDKPQYLSIGKKDYIYPYLKKVTSDFYLENEKWLNALFKQGEFSFTYYYMAGVAKIFCPDMSPQAKRLRKKNVEIALQVLKEPETSFKTTRYFSRSSMIGRIHMDTVWDDYIPYPERPGLLARDQKKLSEHFKKGEYTYLYSFKDPTFEVYQVVEINGKNYAIGDKTGIKLFFSHRNPHYFKYFTKIVPNAVK